MGDSLAMVKSARIDAWLTWTLSAISLTGSILILISFFIATQARKKTDAARKISVENSAIAHSRSAMRRKSTKSWSGRNSSILIRNLALMDFVWFASAFICGNYWLFSPNGGVPRVLCGIVSPLMVYTRLGSLLWSCVITYDVYAKVCRRGTMHDKSGVMIAGSPSSRSRSGEKVFLSTDAGASDPSSWLARLLHTVRIVLWRYKYGIFVNVLAVPVAVVLSSGNADGYCEPGYESVGSWKKSVSLLVLPIFFGIAIQLYVYFKVREKMGLKAYPQSVRKRRRRIMYHYILVSALCWMPTFLLYVIEAAGYSIVTMDIVARATLFTSGFFNFLVYGMHDPFLIRAFRVALSAVGLSCLLKKQAEPLKADKDHNRIVMFNETTIGANADISKDKRAMIRDHRLSKAERITNSDHKVTYAQSVGICQWQSGKFFGWNANHGYVSRWIAADYFSLKRTAIVQGNGNFIGTLNHMIIG